MWGVGKNRIPRTPKTVGDKVPPALRNQRPAGNSQVSFLGRSQAHGSWDLNFNKISREEDRQRWPRTTVTAGGGKQQLPFPVLCLLLSLWGLYFLYQELPHCGQLGGTVLIAEPKSFILWKANTESYFSPPVNSPSIVSPAVMTPQRVSFPAQTRKECFFERKIDMSEDG